MRLSLYAEEFSSFLKVLFFYTKKRLFGAFFRFEGNKDWLVDRLYKQRGRWARPFEHLSFAGLVIVGSLLAPVIAESYAERTTGESLPVVLGVTTEATTAISEKPRGEISTYKVQSGDTLAGIADKFGLSTDTIRWANNLESDKSIKVGQELKILPVTGVAHKVQRGETVWSVAKKYSPDPDDSQGIVQGIVDFPFNTFVNDEEFTLAVGQVLIVPDGVMPKAVPWQPQYYAVLKTPNAGTVTATGAFAWPASGRITQGYRWYHKGLDIANKEAPNIVAADSGQVVAAGWPTGGYGQRVIIDHGNGFGTLYAHFATIFVQEGQTVNRGDVIGQMGSTGRATGVHLHFEIIKDGVKTNPQDYLK